MRFSTTQHIEHAPLQWLRWRSACKPSKLRLTCVSRPKLRRLIPMFLVSAVITACTKSPSVDPDADQKVVHTMVDAMEAASKATPDTEADASVAEQQAMPATETDTSVAPQQVTPGAEAGASITAQNENSGSTIAQSPENGTLASSAETTIVSANTSNEDNSSGPTENVLHAAAQVGIDEAITTNNPVAPTVTHLETDTKAAEQLPALASNPVPTSASEHGSRERAQQHDHASRWWWWLLTLVIPVRALLWRRCQKTRPTRRRRARAALSPLAYKTRPNPPRTAEKTILRRQCISPAWIYRKPEYDKWPIWHVDEAVDFTPWHESQAENNSTMPQTTLAAAEVMTPGLATDSSTPEVRPIPLVDDAADVTSWQDAQTENTSTMPPTMLATAEGMTPESATTSSPLEGHSLSSVDDSMGFNPWQEAREENNSTMFQITLATADAMTPESATNSEPAEVRPISLLENIEHIAYAIDPANPAFFIERRENFPTLIFQDTRAINLATLIALEQALSNVSPKDSALSAWLRTQLSLLQIESAPKAQLQPLYTQLSALIQQQADQASTRCQPYWQARSIELDLAVAKRQTGAARLLRLRQMQAVLTAVLERNDAPVLRAWISVLTYWATCQLGQGALEKYTEAEAFCVRLQDIAGESDNAQLLRAKVLAQRAGVEACSTRIKNLNAAQAILENLFERVPSGEIALAIAHTALVRGGDAQQPEQAKQIYSHALMHAFLAESDPRWRSESLQLRLAIQLAYEKVPGSSIHDPIALTLVQTLESVPTPPAETMRRMAQTYLRNGEFARACELCDEAARVYPATDLLLETWQEATRQWAASLNHPEQHHIWQAAERKRRLIQNAC